MGDKANGKETAEKIHKEIHGKRFVKIQWPSSFLSNRGRGQTGLEVLWRGETVRLTQKGMVELYQTGVPQYPIQNIYNERELSLEVTIKESLTVQKEGSRTGSRTVSASAIDSSSLISHQNFQLDPEVPFWIDSIKHA